MKAVIVTCFESNEERVTFIMESLKNKGYETTAITTNFSHIKKDYRKETPEGFFALKTQSYRKNMSIGRLLSHEQFAFDAFMAVETIKPELVWVIAPCNSLIKRANAYKKKHKDVKIIIDMIDMWPESLPIKESSKESFPFKYWKNLRTRYINCADELVTECDLYQEILAKEYSEKITTIHWAKANRAIEQVSNLEDDTFSLVYIGSINNIIDIDLISKLIKTIDKKVILHIIGDGENKKKIISTLEEVCEVVDHGKVYDLMEKYHIFAMCHAGLNIYKEGLYIGLTTKCLDYFMYGLPIINNIKGDTFKLVEDYSVGINVNSDSIIDTNKLTELRINNKHIYKLYNENFTKDIFENKCIEVIDRVTK